MSRKVSHRSSITNRPTCGGPIKAGLASRSTGFMMSVKPNHHFAPGQSFVDKKNSDYACVEKHTDSTLIVIANSCKNGDDGVIFLKITGGSGNYKYEWYYEVESSGGTKSWIPKADETSSYVNKQNTELDITTGYKFKCVVTDKETGLTKTVEETITNATEQCNQNESYNFCCRDGGCCSGKGGSKQQSCERNCGQCYICA
jgi:hypothetical protein